MFETVLKLQGSQAAQNNPQAIMEFETVLKLQGSQACMKWGYDYFCLRRYWNYKVLKPLWIVCFLAHGLRRYWNYKVLKLVRFVDSNAPVWDGTEITRFSSTIVATGEVRKVWDGTEITRFSSHGYAL